MLVRVEFASFAAVPGKISPVIILKESTGQRTLSVPIGPLDAGVLAMETLKVTPDKPFAIHVAKKILESLGGRLDRVLFYLTGSRSLIARIEVSGRNALNCIECRPCDAIVLALRCKAPLFVREEVFAACSDDGSMKPEDLSLYIASLDAMDFGSYHLD